MEPNFEGIPFGLAEVMMVWVRAAHPVLDPDEGEDFFAVVVYDKDGRPFTVATSPTNNLAYPIQQRTKAVVNAARRLVGKEPI